MVDETIDIALTDRTAANPDARFADIEHLDGETPDARYAFWQAHLTRCIRCNACRNACPTCHCKTCIRDGSHPMEHLHFHITRAFHQAGRCTDCGQCGRVCPQRIPLHLLNRKHIQITEEEAAT
ncbi:MAG: 4Fe-4S dicluster domain-containing protein [Defluviitaleaceae bacterium]|nr:4Fe-4S dicluster domain-containing protein [Defluviitaleaceae bacterium]